MSARAYDTAWRKVRLLVLARDSYRCQLCGEYGDQADHIRALVDGGARLDPANLRCLCSPCNSARGGRLGRARQTKRLPSVW